MYDRGQRSDDDRGNSYHGRGQSGARHSSDRSDYHQPRGRDRESDRDDRHQSRGGDYSQPRRDRSRSRERDRAYPARTDYDDRGRRSDRHYGESSEYQQERPRLSTPSATVIVKGLPAHTSEPALYAALAVYSPQNIRMIASRDTGECKGFAFVEFYSVEYAEYFMQAYAGSAGDQNAPQLIIENRAVMLDYARPDQNPGSGWAPAAAAVSAARDRPAGDNRAPRTDWLCESCGCQNFARRMECYKCNMPRGENAVAISALLHGEPQIDLTAISEVPSATLVAKGLPPLATEEQVAELFRQYAVVSNVLIMRDWATGISRGIAFIEFFGEEHAIHAKNQSADLKLGSNLIKVGYARPGYQKFFQNQMNNAGAMNPYAMAALQAAQWSSNNSYPAAGQSTTQALKSASAAYLPARLKSSKSWPSNFDTEGAAYHFQPKSGCFLDPVTQYYYCPRSKTYYNAVTGDYLKYNGGDDPDELYRKFIVPEPTTTDEVGHAAEAAAAAAATALPTGARKPVILNIGFGGAKSKTKTATPIMPAVIESKSASDAVPAVLLTSANSSAFAKMTENVMKWEERRREENEAEASKTAVVSISVPSAGATQPVCLLCRRQFPSFDVLRRHEKESKLHAENVAKAAAASQASAYRDRASERRILYPNEKEESSEKIQETINKSVEHPAVVVATAAPPRPVDQDEANPGNALLRRMGWTDGTGLGKEGSGEVIPVALNERVSGASLAPGEKTGVGLEDRLPGLSYGDVAEYKQSVYKATKARFDMVSKGNNAS